MGGWGNSGLQMVGKFKQRIRIKNCLFHRLDLRLLCNTSSKSHFQWLFLSYSHPSENWNFLLVQHFDVGKHLQEVHLFNYMCTCWKHMSEHCMQCRTKSRHAFSYIELLLMQGIPHIWRVWDDLKVNVNGMEIVMSIHVVCPIHAYRGKRRKAG